MIEFKGQNGPVYVDASSIQLVGYSGRDTQAVEAHIRELESMGVPRPREVPAVWEVREGLLSFDSRIVASGQTSGEIEPVLILSSGKVFLAVGSDHTDRAMEATSMQQAKEACPKIVSRECLPFDEQEWDSVELSSQILLRESWTEYQLGTLDALLPASWFLDRFGDGRDRIVFCGTLPARGGIRTDARAFRGRLVTGENRLTFEYSIESE